MTLPFFHFNRPGALASEGTLESFWLQGVLGGSKQLSETDFTEDLKKLDVPTLIMHEDDDQFVPIDELARLSVKLVKGATAVQVEA